MIKKSLKLDRPAIAASVSDKDIVKVNRDILKNIDLIELRVDLFSNLSEDNIKKIFDKVRCFGKSIIATVRKSAEGGKFNASEKERLKIFNFIVPLSDLVDIEIFSDIFKDVKNLVKENGKLLIGSFHDFNSTPEYKELEFLYEKAKNKGADIVKLATMAENTAELKKMTLFTLNHAEEDIVTLCMGKMAFISRIFFPIIGSVFTFGAVGKPKAPGQLSVIKLRQYISTVCSM